MALSFLASKLKRKCSLTKDENTKMNSSFSRPRDLMEIFLQKLRLTLNDLPGDTFNTVVRVFYKLCIKSKS